MQFINLDYVCVHAFSIIVFQLIAFLYSCSEYFKLILFIFYSLIYYYPQLMEIMNEFDDDYVDGREVNNGGSK
jgi:uncharacterized RDD family membrane protein YckC